MVLKPMGSLSDIVLQKRCTSNLGPTQSKLLNISNDLVCNNR